MTKPKTTKLTDKQKQVAKYEKAKAAASKHRKRNRALRDQYMGDDALQEELRETLIADLLRVFDHPCNPYKGFAASRNRYRDLGQYPEILVIDFFGNHQEFLRAAGLHDKRNTTKVRNKSAKLHTQQDIARFARENVLRHVGKHAKGHADFTAPFTMVFASDFHSEKCHPLALRVLKDVSEYLQPEVICVGGDLVDFPQISSHRKLPGHFALSVYGETQWGRNEVLAPLRELCPDARMDFIIGNHEYRLVNFLADTAPELADMPSLDFNALFGLDEFEVNLVCRSNFLATTTKAKKQDVLENWVIYGKSILAHHGLFCTKFSTAQELAAYNISTICGHTHRPQIFHSNSLGTGPVVSINSGMMSHQSVGRDYIHGFPPWNTSLTVLEVHPAKGYVTPHIVSVFEDWATFEGMEWQATPEELHQIREMRLVG